MDMIFNWMRETFLGMLVSKVLMVAVVLFVTWIVVRLVNKSFRTTVDRLNQMGNSAATLVAFGRYVALAAVYFAAFSVIVSNIPALNSGINKLMAAGGILVVVAGVAAQSVLGGVAAGIMILVFKPFVIGDVVNVVSAGVTGTVEEINLQHTVLRTIENKRVIIPNSTMNTAIVENFDYGDKCVCLTMDVGVTYECDLEKAMRVLAETVAKHPDYLDRRTEADKRAGAPAVTVRVAELGDSAVVLRALLWAKDNGTAVVMKCELLKAVKLAFDREDVAMAYPHLVVVNE